jgi:PIN domain nuclease of toxin-antitoxin system
VTERVVLDASAVLAVAHGEPGAEVVEPLVDGSSLSAVNWSEVARVCLSTGRKPAALRSLLVDAGCEIVPFTTEDADLAAALWPATRAAGLSLGDRACLALARRLDRVAVTTDRAWTGLDVGIDVVCAR